MIATLAFLSDCFYGLNLKKVTCLCAFLRLMGKFWVNLRSKKKPLIAKRLLECGSPSWTRTSDKRINSAKVL